MDKQHMANLLILLRVSMAHKHKLLKTMQDNLSRESQFTQQLWYKLLLNKRKTQMIITIKNQMALLLAFTYSHGSQT